MRRQSAEGAEGSLEMLLDTITNAFGGILFLGLLIAILLRTTGVAQPTEAPKVASKLEVIQLENTLDQRRHELESAMRAQQQSAQLLEQLSGKELLSEHRELVDLRTELARLRNLAEQQQQELKEMEASTNNLVNQAAQQQQTVEKLEQAVALSRKELERETESRTQNTRMPRGHQSSKREFSIILRYGRAYADRIYDPRTRAERINDQDFLILGSQGRHLRITPKPYAGIAVTREVRFDDALRNIAATRKPSEYDIVLGVWSDSFREFQIVKQAIVRQGFEYRILPMNDGGGLIEGGTTDKEVQ